MIEMKRRLHILLKTACLLLATLLLGTNLQAQSARYFDALRLYHAGKPEKAIEQFEKELAANPDNDAAHYYLGTTLLSSERPDMDRVEKCFRKALELSPDNYWYKYSLALFYTETSRPELASPLLEELMAEHPKKSDLYFDAASAYVSQNDTRKALEVIDKIESVAGKSEMIAISKMDLIRKQTSGAAGEIAAYEYLENYYRDCQTPRLAAMLGDYYQRTFRDSLALDLYTQAIEMDETYAPAYYGRAHSYQSLRMYDLYFEDIRTFLRDQNIAPVAKADYLNHVMEAPQFVQAFQADVDSMMLDAHLSAPEDSTVSNAVALYYYRTDRQYLGIELMRQMSERYPESYSQGFQYLLMLYYNNSWNPLINAATVQLQRFPKGRDIMVLRATAFRQLKNYESAIADYEQMLADAPKDSSTIVMACTSLGDLYYETGNLKKAYASYEKALKQAPNHLPALNNYAYFLSLEGKKLKKAKEMSKKTIEAEPDNPTYLDTYAWILHLMGQDVEAKAIFKHAMLYGGKEQPAVLDHYAEVLYSLKEYDLAYIYWNQAKALDTTGELKIDEKVRERKKNQ